MEEPTHNCFEADVIMCFNDNLSGDGANFCWLAIDISSVFVESLPNIVMFVLLVFQGLWQAGAERCDRELSVHAQE